MSATQHHISDFDLAKLQAYKERRKAEEYFEMEELFDLLDSIVEDFPDDEVDESSTEEEEDNCTNHYACVNCSNDWSIEADSEHEDDCGECGTTMTPYYSDSYYDSEPRGKEIGAAYSALPQRQEALK